MFRKVNIEKGKFKQYICKINWRIEIRFIKLLSNRIMFTSLDEVAYVHIRCGFVSYLALSKVIKVRVKWMDAFAINDNAAE